MSGTPIYKIYNPHRTGSSKKGEYVAACKYPDDAAALASAIEGDIYYDHKHLLWQTSVDGDAGFSYDQSVIKMQNRRKEIQEKAFKEIYGKNA
jgi:hypothetical protein